MHESEKLELISQAYNMAKVEKLASTPVFTAEELHAQPNVYVSSRLIYNPETDRREPKVEEFHTNSEERQKEMLQAEEALTDKRFRSEQDLIDPEIQAKELVDYEKLIGLEVLDDDIDLAIHYVLQVAANRAGGIKYPFKKNYLSLTAWAAREINKSLLPALSTPEQRTRIQEDLRALVRQHLNLKKVTRSFRYAEDRDKFQSLFFPNYEELSRDDIDELGVFFQIVNLPTRRLIFSMAQLAQKFARDYDEKALVTRKMHSENIELDSGEKLLLSTTTLDLLRELLDQKQQAA